jgi:predicted ester cyclase
MRKFYLLIAITFELLSYCEGQTADSTRSSNKKLIERTLAALDKNDFDALDKCLADNFTFDWAGNKAPLNRQDFYASVKEKYTAFPDWHHTIDEMLLDNDKVFIRVTRTGTQMGEHFGIKPTNIKITNSACYLATIENNRVLRWWVLEDRWGVLKALGVEIKRPATTNKSDKK